MKSLHSLIVALVTVSSGPAAILSSNSYLWTTADYGVVRQIELNTTVFDNFQGDASKQEWRYTVQNISYYGLAPSESGFGLIYFRVEMGASVGAPFPNFGYGVSDRYAPPGWRPNSPLISIGGLAWSTDRSNTLLPGETAVFGFTVSNLIAGPGYEPGPHSIVTGGAMVMAWVPNMEFEMMDAIAGPADIPGPPIPEPAAAYLVGVGLAMLAGSRAIRRERT
jgi:hypothetical protein